jgi:leucyl-tRNA synthetase
MYNNEDLYITVMFPYPSGDGLHIGHVYNYAIMDTFCRYKRFLGNSVFQPFGMDSFGLPAENYAKKVGRDPRDVTYENIEKFRIQMDKMNTEFNEVLITSDPSYQKWTQWLFLKLKEHGLAYKKDGEVNYCPSCETVLANEQVTNNWKCERCKTDTVRKTMNQWYFKITDYKDRLIANLDKIDYPKSTINAQRMWLENLHDWCVSRQRKWGCPIPIEGETDTMDTFVCSSYYLIRYCDPDNENELCSKDKYKQVDLYVGGNEHACMHLIYARFINMFLYDIGVVSEPEPFKRVIHQGMILNEGEKMSKSKGNTVNPNDYDPDFLRFYLMFIGHYFDGGSWSDKNIVGIQRFFNRFKEWVSREGNDDLDINTFQKKIFEYTESFKFNKVVSEFMTLVNKERTKNLKPEIKEQLISILEIYMPGLRDKLK